VVAGNATHDQSLIPVATEWRVGVIKGKGKTGEKEGWVRGKGGTSFRFPSSTSSLRGL